MPENRREPAASGKLRQAATQEEHLSGVFFDHLTLDRTHSLAHIQGKVECTQQRGRLAHAAQCSEQLQRRLRASAGVSASVPHMSRKLSRTSMALPQPNHLHENNFPPQALSLLASEAGAQKDKGVVTELCFSSPLSSVWLRRFGTCCKRGDYPICRSHLWS